MSLLKNRYLKKFLILVILFYAPNVYANSNSKILEGILKSIIPGGEVNLSSSNEQYITGKNLKNLLFSNEITIKTEEGQTHAYHFDSNMTYEVFSYPQRNLLGNGTWKIRSGFQVDLTYTVPDHIYLEGFRSGLGDSYFIFVSNPKIIKVVGNIQNPNDYVIAQIVNELPKTKVEQIVKERIAKERVEQERLAKKQAELERLEKIEKELIAKQLAEEERLTKIQILEFNRLVAEKRLEKERLEKIKEEEKRNQAILNNFLIIGLIILLYFIWKKIKLKKEIKRQKFLSENYGERLIDESSNIIKSKGDIKSWDNKNKEYLGKVKKHIIDNIKQNNKNILENFSKLSKEISKFEKDIEKEEDLFKDLHKKYPFIKKIISARGQD